jgi:hypothetical protein
MLKTGLAVVTLVGTLGLFAPASAEAGVFTWDDPTKTYTYVGDLFNFCGYGCPEHAPVDPRGVDYITATLTFAAKLPGDIAFGDPFPVPLSWTIKDFLDEASFAGVGTPLSPEGGPGLILSTDANGDIVNYFMVGFVGGLNSEDNFVGDILLIANPGLCFDDCDSVLGTDFAGIRVRLGATDTEWNGGVVVPVPEPGTYSLIGLGLAGLAARKRRR